MRLITSLFIAFSSSIVLATTFEGRLTKSKSQILFSDSGLNKLYTLTGASPMISTYLNKLSEGDFISVEGSKNAADTILMVNSINYVGLGILLGTWVGDDSYCYTFSSYTQFLIFRRVDKRCLPTYSPNYTYFLNPTNGSWVMLLSGERGSYVGDLIINNPKDIEIELYDSETGDILRNIHLRK